MIPRVVARKHVHGLMPFALAVFLVGSLSLTSRRHSIPPVPVVAGSSAPIASVASVPDAEPELRLSEDDHYAQDRACAVVGGASWHGLRYFECWHGEPHAVGSQVLWETVATATGVDTLAMLDPMGGASVLMTWCLFDPDGGAPRLLSAPCRVECASPRGALRWERPVVCP